MGDRYDRIRELRDHEPVHEIEGVSSLGATERALLCCIPDVGQVYIPFSQIRSGSEIFEAHQPAGRLVITCWLAEQRGWI